MLLPRAPQDTPWTLDVLGRPAAHFAIAGIPGPQGSKRHVGGGRMIESSKKVAPWRKAVYEAAKAHLEDLLAYADPEAAGGPLWPLDGPLVVDMVFTLPKGTTLPKWRDWHDKVPDVSKLARSTEDAITGVLWADDARVCAYRRLEKRYVGSSDPDALPWPGAVVRIWPVPTHLIDQRKSDARRTGRTTTP